MAQWKVYNGETAPQCTGCGMWAPFARYRRKNGMNARKLTDFCPNCGRKMEGCSDCAECKYAENGKWQDNGICYACREDPWVYGRKQYERVYK